MKGMVAILIAGVLIPVAAVAQEWKPYTYADPGFTVQFPAAPAVETGRTKSASGASLPVTRYVVRQERIIYTLSVVNYSGTNDDSLTTIGETQKSLTASGKVTASAGTRIKRHFGRALSVAGADGSRSVIGIYFVDKHLYTLVAQELPPNTDEESGDAVRFQESLQFSDEDSGFGGFGGLFGGNAGDHPKARPEPEPKAQSKLEPKPEPRSAPSPHTDATCAGKSAGDAVQLQTPGGPVAATCTLVAQPDVPPSR